MKIYKVIAEELKLKRKDGKMHSAKITSSHDAAAYFRELFDEETLEISESAIVIYLNQSNNVVGYFRASQGGITGTVVDVRLILRKALDCYAVKMMVAHNHPSGNATPSQPDINITRKLVQAGDVLEVKLLDHLIITAESYYSFADEGQI
jgi:DNA repair protein RadC